MCHIAGGKSTSFAADDILLIKVLVPWKWKIKLDICENEELISPPPHEKVT